MAAVDKALVKANGQPAPQYYNPQTDQFEYITGRDGANAFIQHGTVAAEAWEGSATETKTFSDARYAFSIANDGIANVSFTINGQTRKVFPGESYYALFDAFTSVTITATSAYRAEVLK
ncbi:hypothetical protein [Planomicrobium sp. CPCC 101079]|uniref:hypothetical protein n=1 Tax=Planomicrobium sp. CPCC 101079 TaxID=2599618 RepID=UPI0011B553F1|nr:hypothetical protein [Planomicrobium sp. CPCC 101079]TWT04591.1 hypothetical protein FQV28_08285 [Planomicrobium sp. CPCC 101079]